MMHQTITGARALVYFTAEAKPLADALDYLARFVAEKQATSRRSWGAPVGLAAVRIDADASGTIVLSCCNLDVQAVVTVSGDVEAPGVIGLNAATLRDMVKAAPRDARVTVSQTEAGRADLRYGRVSQRLAVIDKDMAMLRPALGNAMDIDGAALGIDLQRVAPFITTHEQRDGALLLQRTATGFEIIAGDGHNLAVAMRDAPEGTPWRAAICERGAEALARAVKAWPGGTFSLGWERQGVDRSRVTLIGDRFALTVMASDGDAWGDWREQSARVLGTELQRTFTPDDEPRLNPEAMKRFAKVATRVDVEIGGAAARLSLPGDASWLGFSMLAPEGTVPKGYSYGPGPEAQARDYLADLMARHGIEPAPGEQQLVIANGRVIGMTCGTYHATRRARCETVLDWETLTEREVEIVEHEAGWQDGAFSVVMPRVRESVVAEISVELGDECLPLARNAAGSVYMTPAQVAKWCGPVDPSTHVEIPRAPVRRAWSKKAAPVLAPKPVTGRAALMMTAQEMHDYAEACQRAADLANGAAIDAEPVAAPEPVEPVATPAGPELAETAESPSLPATAPLPAPGSDEVAELRAMVLAMSARIDALEGGAPVAPATVSEPVAVSVAPERDRALRLKLVRTYLALRAARRRASETEARLAEAEMHLDLARSQRVAIDNRVAELESIIARGQALIEQNRADRRRYDATEQLLIDARARGNRLLRVAMGQRTALARSRVDLRGARAESGALRRQLAQALQPAPAPAAPAGTMADAFARAGL